MGHNKTLSATLDSEYAVKNTEYAIICVGTPLLPNGDLDMSYILKSAEIIESLLIIQIIFTLFQSAAQ